MTGQSHKFHAAGTAYRQHCKIFASFGANRQESHWTGAREI